MTEEIKKVLSVSMINLMEYKILIKAVAPKEVEQIAAVTSNIDKIKNLILLPDEKHYLNQLHRQNFWQKIKFLFKIKSIT